MGLSQVFSQLSRPFNTTKSYNNGSSNSNNNNEDGNGLASELGFGRISSPDTSKNVKNVKIFNNPNNEYGFQHHQNIAINSSRVHKNVPRQGFSYPVAVSLDQHHHHQHFDNLSNHHQNNSLSSFLGNNMGLKGLSNSSVGRSIGNIFNSVSNGNSNNSSRSGSVNHNRIGQSNSNISDPRQFQGFPFDDSSPVPMRIGRARPHMSRRSSYYNRIRNSHNTNTNRYGRLGISSDFLEITPTSGSSDSDKFDVMTSSDANSQIQVEDLLPEVQYLYPRTSNYNNADPRSNSFSGDRKVTTYSHSDLGMLTSKNITTSDQQIDKVETPIYEKYQNYTYQPEIAWIRSKKGGEMDYQNKFNTNSSNDDGGKIVTPIGYSINEGDDVSSVPLSSHSNDPSQNPNISDLQQEEEEDDMLTKLDPRVPKTALVFPENHNSTSTATAIDTPALPTAQASTLDPSASTIPSSANIQKLHNNNYQRTTFQTEIPVDPGVSFSAGKNYIYSPQTNSSISRKPFPTPVYPQMPSSTRSSPLTLPPLPPPPLNSMSALPSLTTLQSLSQQILTNSNSNHSPEMLASRQYINVHYPISSSLSSPIASISDESATNSYSSLVVDVNPFRTSSPEESVLSSSGQQQQKNYETVTLPDSVSKMDDQKSESHYSTRALESNHLPNTIVANGNLESVSASMSQEAVVRSPAESRSQKYPELLPFASTPKQDAEETKPAAINVKNPEKLLNSNASENKVKVINDINNKALKVAPRAKIPEIDEEPVTSFHQNTKPDTPGLESQSKQEKSSVDQGPSIHLQPASPIEFHNKAELPKKVKTKEGSTHAQDKGKRVVPNNPLLASPSSPSPLPSCIPKHKKQGSLFSNFHFLSSSSASASTTQPPIHHLQSALSNLRPALSLQSVVSQESPKTLSRSSSATLAMIMPYSNSVHSSFLRRKTSLILPPPSSKVGVVRRKTHKDKTIKSGDDGGKDGSTETAESRNQRVKRSKSYAGFIRSEKDKAKGGENDERGPATTNGLLEPVKTPSSHPLINGATTFTPGSAYQSLDPSSEQSVYTTPEHNILPSGVPGETQSSTLGGLSGNAIGGVAGGTPGGLHRSSNRILLEATARSYQQLFRKTSEREMR